MKENVRRAATKTARRLCQQLRTERRLQDMTQPQASQRTGIAQANISRLETGQETPNLVSFVAYAATLGITIRLEPKEQQTCPMCNVRQSQ